MMIKLTNSSQLPLPQFLVYKNNSFELKLIDDVVITNLWYQKSRLDSIFDSNRQLVYYSVRDKFFPEDKTGSYSFKNRAGDKLYEIIKSVNLIKINNDEHAFIDICGGPGAWSELLLKITKYKGFGITLNVKDSNFNWYKTLYNNKKWKELKGINGTGDIFVTDNILDAKNKTKNHNIMLAVADGGISLPTSNSTSSMNLHMEHLQEIYSARLILSEFYTICEVLQSGGNFCCKLFDTFTAFTVSIIYLTTHLFDQCYIIKPLHSRRVNSERYLVGIGYKPNLIYTNFLKTIHETWDDKLVGSLVDIDVMKNDTVFWNTLREYTLNICIQQTNCINKIMNEVDRIILI